MDLLHNKCDKQKKKRKKIHGEWNVSECERIKERERVREREKERGRGRASGTGNLSMNFLSHNQNI